jgi:methyltransferase
MTTRETFAAVLIALVVHRLHEQLLTKKNERRIVREGGELHADPTASLLVVLHATWLVATACEVGFLDRTFELALALPALPMIAAGAVLRNTAIEALGRRWTTRIVTFREPFVVTTGPYRYLQHPYYVGTVLVIAGVSLLHSAWMSAVVFTTGAMVIAVVRMIAEETVLSRMVEYRRAFGIYLATPAPHPVVAPSPVRARSIERPSRALAQV